MAAHVILILLDSSEKSVGSHVPRVILFGAIPTNPSEDSLHVASELPLVSPFLCSDDSKENAQRDYCCWFHITVTGSTLVLLDKVGAAAGVLKIYSKSLVLLE
nr:hypothetical protein [Tanacetum cinerariifolium]